MSFGNVFQERITRNKNSYMSIRVNIGFKSSGLIFDRIGKGKIGMEGKIGKKGKNFL